MDHVHLGNCRLRPVLSNFDDEYDSYYENVISEEKKMAMMILLVLGNSLVKNVNEKNW